jgi:hypothetical protein
MLFISKKVFNVDSRDFCIRDDKCNKIYDDDFTLNVLNMDVGE